MAARTRQQDAPPRKCPKCRLINPPEAQRCDCGWDFVVGRQQRSYLPQKPLPTAASVGGGVIAIILLVKLAMMVLRVLASP